MPAFTFEKILPRRQSASVSSWKRQPNPQISASQTSDSSPRSGIIQVLGRFVEARVRDDDTADHAPPRRPLPR
jgi:hypothetical protein